MLLLGNHDLHYFCDEACVGTRFDMEIAADASKLFLGNIHLFQYAFQDGECLFTHAGVSQLWFDYDFCGDAERSLAEQLNNPAADQVPALLRVGYARGGRRGDTGGIFWADKRELEEPLHGFTQIVGHNRVAEVTERTGPFEPMKDFAAIDFETANEQRTSVCSVGVVVVRGGEIVDRFYSLIRPEPEYYSYWNTRVHGLTLEDTAEAPVFPYVWEKVAPLIEGLPLVAHNVPGVPHGLPGVCFSLYLQGFPPCFRTAATESSASDRCSPLRLRPHAPSSCPG